LPSDKTFLEGMAAARQTGRKTFRKAAPVLPEEPAPEIAPAESLPPRARAPLQAPEARTRAENLASLVEA